MAFEAPTLYVDGSADRKFHLVQPPLPRIHVSTLQENAYMCVSMFTCMSDVHEPNSQ